MQFRTLKLRKNPDCPVCGTHPTVTELIDYDQFCGVPSPATAGPLEGERNQPAAEQNVIDGVPQISVEELKRRLDAHDPVFVLDVREPHEVPIANLGAPLIPVGEIEQRLGELADKRDAEIVVHCRSGARSQKAALALKKAGFEHVSNLAGGILAWADRIDPAMPKY